MSKKHSMTQSDSNRIKSTQSRKTGGQTPKKSFAARAERAATKRNNRR